MLIPKHWWCYGQSRSLVLWTSVDIDAATVFIHGFNCAESDMSIDKIKFVRTSVPNFQLLSSVPVRMLRDFPSLEVACGKEIASSEPKYINEKGQEFYVTKTRSGRRFRIDRDGSTAISAVIYYKQFFFRVHKMKSAKFTPYPKKEKKMTVEAMKKTRIKHDATPIVEKVKKLKEEKKEICKPCEEAKGRLKEARQELKDIRQDVKGEYQWQAQNVYARLYNKEIEKEKRYER